jgi:hypothetical protein
MATIGELLPKFCTELQDLINSAGRKDLVDQVRGLPIVSRGTCGDRNCAHFYTSESPQGSYETGHSTILLGADVGFVALDVVHDVIVAVEVLDRPDVKEPLDAAMPLSNARRASCLTCPACGFLTLTGITYGSYMICEVCDWEDDGMKLANPACGGGANRESLIDAQLAALDRFPIDVAEAEGVSRSAAWRPLNASETALALEQREQKYWMNSAIVDVTQCYWQKSQA